MAVGRGISGRLTILSPVIEEDADFVISLRTDPKLNKFFGPIIAETSFQRDWIRNQRLLAGDYYYTIINKQSMRRVGLVGLSHCTAKEAEFTRWMCTSPVNSLESMLLMCDFAFDISMSRERIYLRVGRDNSNALSFYKRFGIDRIEEDAEEFYGIKSYKLTLTRSEYVNLRKTNYAVVNQMAQTRGL